MFQNPFRNSGTRNLNPTVVAYKEYKNTAKNLVQEIIEYYTDEKALNYTSQLMGIKHGKELLLESEEEINFLMDFMVYEYQVDGKNFLERYLNSGQDLNLKETEIIKAKLSAYTSLFEIFETDANSATVTLIDQLNAGEVVKILDINLSKTASPGILLFTRIIPCKDFNTTSGIFAIFSGKSLKALLKKYKVMKSRVKSDRESVQRFIAFFKINRTEGLDVETIDV
jgi:hypothetical protein